MSPIKETLPSSENEILLLDKRRKREPAELPRNGAYDNFFENVMTAMAGSPSQTITIVYEGEASIREAYLDSQFLRTRMRKQGLRINTAIDRESEPDQARLIVGPYAPKE